MSQAPRFDQTRVFAPRYACITAMSLRHCLTIISLSHAMPSSGTTYVTPHPLTDSTC